MTHDNKFFFLKANSFFHFSKRMLFGKLFLFHTHCLFPYLCISLFIQNGYSHMFFLFYSQAGELGKVRWMSVDFFFLTGRKRVTFLVLITIFIIISVNWLGLFGFYSETFWFLKSQCSLSYKLYWLCFEFLLRQFIVYKHKNSETLRRLYGEDLSSSLKWWGQNLQAKKRERSLLKVGIRICPPPGRNKESGPAEWQAFVGRRGRGSHSNPNNRWFDIRFMLCFTLMRRTVINQLNAFPNQSGLEGSRYWREWTHSSRPGMQLAGCTTPFPHS